MEKKAEVKLGVLIEGTMRPIDTIPAMLREAQRRGLKWERILQESNAQFIHADSIGDAMDLNFEPYHNAPYWKGSVGIDGSWTSNEDAIHTVGELIDLLNEDLAGATFGTQEGDPACLGYWAETGDLDGEGVHFGWRHVRYGIELYQMKGRATVFFQLGDDMNKFLQDIGAVDFVWMNDPKNEEGRVFKAIEEHYDAIMNPYFGN